MKQITSPAYQPVDREAIWSALFAWFQQQLGSSFASMGRKHIAPPDLTVADQPAFFQVAARERHIPNQKPGLPTKLILRGYLIVYVFDDSPNEDIGTQKKLSETMLNKLLFAVDSALVPDDARTGKFTIGLATRAAHPVRSSTFSKPIAEDEEGGTMQTTRPRVSFWTPSGRHKYVIREDLGGKPNSSASVRRNS